MLKDSLIISAFIAVSMFSFSDDTQATQTVCKTDSFGTIRCHGKTSEGQSVETTARTDSFGTQRTTGKIGDKPVKQTCKTNSLGSTYCH